ncbi:MAG: hypothetical protein M1374_01755 [Firmicutes bacterium]|nr:hypothetical protein [Bacillota bacterium]
MAKKRPLRVKLFSKIQLVEDPLSGLLSEQRHIQPFAATKTYICPGCNQEIWPRTGHLVIVPLADTNNRRHWHTSCWERKNRLPKN